MNHSNPKGELGAAAGQKGVIRTTRRQRIASLGRGGVGAPCTSPQPSINKCPETRRNLGYLGQTGQHKVVQLKAYLSNNTWLLKVKKEDAEWLGLEPFETYGITFHKREGEKAV